MKSLRLFRWSAVLITAASIAAACSDSGPAAPTGPEAVARFHGNPSSLVTTTVWDFVQIAGADGPQGNPATFTIAGAGSIVATATITDPATQVYAKGFGSPPGSEERGLGICANFGVGDQCATSDEDEIGDYVPSGGANVYPSVWLDLTGLAAGSTPQSVTIASLQLGEIFAAFGSTDGVTYTPLATFTGTGVAPATFTFSVPATTKYIRFDPVEGNYLIQSLTVQSETTTEPGFGRMTGGGSNIDAGVGRITKGLTLHCDITLSNNLEINWPGHKWHLDKPITSAECILDPAYDQPPPAAPFNTFNGTATGKLDGVDGSTIAFTFIDAGEPGKNDKVALKIWDKFGTLVLDVPLGLVSGGNLQAHYDQPHGCNVNNC